MPRKNRKGSAQTRGRDRRKLKHYFDIPGKVKAETQAIPTDWQVITPRLVSKQAPENSA